MSFNMKSYSLSICMGAYGGFILAYVLLHILGSANLMLGFDFAAPVQFVTGLIIMTMVWGSFVALPVTAICTLVLLKTLLKHLEQAGKYKKHYLIFLGPIGGASLICLATLIMYPLFNKHEPSLDGFMVYLLFGVCCGSITCLALYVFEQRAHNKSKQTDALKRRVCLRRYVSGESYEVSIFITF